MKYTILTCLILTYVLFTIPFSFNYIVFGAPNPWFLTFLFLLIWGWSFAVYKGKLRLGKSELVIVVSLLLYTLVHLTLGRGQFTNWLSELFTIFLVINVYKIITMDYEVAKKLRKFSSAIMIVCVVSVIFLALLYNTMPSLFSYELIGDYKMATFPLFGNVYVGDSNPRYCWYFSEPSYIGFFLAIYVIVLLSRVESKNVFVLILTVVAGYISGAMTFWLCLLPCIVMMIMKKFLPFSSTKYRIGLFVLLLSALIVVQTFDFSNLVYTYEFLERNSFGDRQYRMLLSKDIMDKMGVFDYLVGMGANYVAQTYESGESNSYYKLLVEYGVIFTSSYIFLLNKFLRSDYLFFSVVVGLMAVILFLTPFLWLFILLGYNSYRLRRLDLKRI